MIAQPGPHRKVSNYLVPKNLCQRGCGPMAESEHNPVGVENRTDANPG